MQHSTKVTHTLESKRQKLSAGFKQSKAQQLHTCWRAKHRGHQQAKDASQHSSHSHPRVSKIIIVRLNAQ